jgi:hypothetical protein
VRVEHDSVERSASGRLPLPCRAGRATCLARPSDPPQGGRSAASASRQLLHRRRLAEPAAAADLPPCGGDVRQDRGGRRRALTSASETSATGRGRPHPRRTARAGDTAEGREGSRYRRAGDDVGGEAVRVEHDSVERSASGRPRLACRPSPPRGGRSAASASALNLQTSEFGEDGGANDLPPRGGDGRQPRGGRRRARRQPRRARRRALAVPLGRAPGGEAVRAMMQLQTLALYGAPLCLPASHPRGGRSATPPSSPTSDAGRMSAPRTPRRWTA